MSEAHPLVFKLLEAVELSPWERARRLPDEAAAEALAGYFRQKLPEVPEHEVFTFGHLLREIAYLSPAVGATCLAELEALWAAAAPGDLVGIRAMVAEGARASEGVAASSDEPPALREAQRLVIWSTALQDPERARDLVDAWWGAAGDFHVEIEVLLRLYRKQPALAVRWLEARGGCGDLARGVLLLFTQELERDPDSQLALRLLRCLYWGDEPGIYFFIAGIRAARSARPRLRLAAQSMLEGMSDRRPTRDWAQAAHEEMEGPASRGLTRGGSRGT